MKKFLILLFLLFSTSCYAVNPLSGIPADKVLHFETSYLMCDFMQDGLKMDNTQVFVGIFGMSLAKEYLDSKLNGKWDNNDIMANMAAWLTRRYFVVKIKF